jgi:predicted DNA-binding protein (MmcQ/YjbR family)
MNIDNSPIHKYILIDTSKKPCYAFISSANLTKYEAKTKNYAYAMNRSNKKYVLKKDWK